MNRLLSLTLVALAVLLLAAGAGAQSASFTVPVTYQPYEQGFMIWRADSGEIYVYFQPQGPNLGGALAVYPSRRYGRLPDNPVGGDTPPGRVRPIMGFGRVWGNFTDVRRGLGWAVGSELSYDMQITPNVRGTFFNTLPDGRQLFTDFNHSTWNFSGGVIPTPGWPTPFPFPTPFPSPTAPPVVVAPEYVAYQPYERGFMIWRSSTEDIITFFEDGRLQQFHVSSYNDLPDNPITEPVPDGRVRPMNGFGRVWGNIEDIRSRLGWAIARETGYNTLFQERANPNGTQVCFALPDGRTVNRFQVIGTGDSWTFAGVCR